MNGLIDEMGGIDLPQKPVDETAIKELKSKAKYSQSKEFRELRAKADARVEFYQKFLPDGRPIGTANRADMERKWENANLIIAEINGLFDEFDNAEQILKEDFGEQMGKYYHPQTDFFVKRNLPPPTTVSHGLEDDIREKVTSVNPINWRMEGAGKLVADTDVGRLVQFVPTDLICTGTDSQGKPILAKIGEQQYI